MFTSHISIYTAVNLSDCELIFHVKIEFCMLENVFSNSMNCVASFLDFHKTAPYVVTGSVDQTVKVWECR